MNLRGRAVNVNPKMPVANLHLIPIEQHDPLVHGRFETPSRTADGDGYGIAATEKQKLVVEGHDQVADAVDGGFPENR